MSTPILMILFNRPNHARRVFDAITLYKPERLYIAIDGARANRADDQRLIDENIKILDSVNWPCEVKTMIRKENLGCKMAVSSAITWFFENEDKGIILEDDCLPSTDFFTMCDYLLPKYENVDSVMHINGVNFQDGIQRGASSYYFSKVCHVWGWATWKRAWQKYDIKMDGVESFFDSGLYKSFLNYKTGFRYWKSAFTKTKNLEIDTWDYQWVFSVWKNNGLAIAPNYNLVSNIGFDGQATHTKNVNKLTAEKPFDKIRTFIDAEDIFVQNYDADFYSFNKLFRIKKRPVMALKIIIKKFLKID